jgi:uncharacterized protein YkwD
MAEHKKPAAKRVAAAGTVAGKSKSAKTSSVAIAVKKVAAKKAAIATAEPKKPKATVVKKAAAPAAEKKTPAGKAVASKSPSKGRPSPEERYRMVQTAAYFIAERNGFQGCSTDHWAAAELEIAAQLGE